MEYWEEYGFSRRRKVNKRTGKLNKKEYKTKEYDLDTQGLECINRNCGYEYNGNFKANDTENEVMEDIFDKEIKRKV